MYDTVVQTTPIKTEIPEKVRTNWNMFAPGVKRIIMTDNDCIKFMLKDYGEKIGRLLVTQFKYLKEGAHKADLFRYAWLYKRGGVYMDIKTELIKPFRELFPKNNVCYVVTSLHSSKIYNGIIATPPTNPMMLELLKGAMQMTNDKKYLHIIWHGYDVLKKYTGGIKPGLNRTPSSLPDIWVYTEEALPNSVCNNKTDRYNLCMFVTHNNIPFIKLRYNDYPWGSKKKSFRFPNYWFFYIYEHYFDSIARIFYYKNDTRAFEYLNALHIGQKEKTTKNKLSLSRTHRMKF